MTNRLRYFLLTLLLLLAGAAQVWADDTFTLSMETGALGHHACANTGSTSFYCKWTSTQTAPQFVLTAGTNNGLPNNMNAVDGNLCLYTGGQSAVFTLSVLGDYAITGYTITFSNVNTSKNQTITPSQGGTAQTAEGEGSATVEATGLSCGSTQLTLTGDNVGAKITSFTITYTAATPYAYRVVGSTQTPKDNFWLDIEHASTVGESNSPNVNHVASKVYVEGSGTTWNLRNANAKYVCSAGNTWSCRILDTPKVSWNIEEVTSASGIYYFRNNGNTNTTNNYLFKNTEYQDGGAFYMNGTVDNALQLKRYAWTDLHAITAATGTDASVVYPTVTDGEQTLKGYGTHVAGETVTLTVAPGYVVSSLTVTDADGTAVTDADGNAITATNNTFTMPDGDVTITATAYKMPPFEPTTITDGAFASTTKWYAMTLNGKYLYNSGSDFRVTDSKNNRPAYLFAFTHADGAAVDEGYSIYNMQAGASKTVYANNPADKSIITSVESATGTWSIGPNIKDDAKGYWMKEVDANSLENAYMNLRGDLGLSYSAMAIWANGNATSDAGSRITFVEVTAAELKALLASAVSSVEDNVGTAPGQTVITNQTKFDEAKALTTTADATVEQLATALAALPGYYTINPMVAGHFWMQNKGNSKYAMATDTNLSASDGYASMDNVFLAETATNGFNIKSLSKDKYVQAATQSTTVTMDETAVDYIFQAMSPTSFAIGKYQATDYQYLHNNPASGNSNVVGWERSATNSQWTVEMVDVYAFTITNPTGETVTPQYEADVKKAIATDYIVVPKGHTIDTEKLKSTDVEDYTWAYSVDAVAKTVTLTYTAIPYYHYTLSVSGLPADLPADRRPTIAVRSDKDSPYTTGNTTSPHLTLSRVLDELTPADITAPNVTLADKSLYLATVTVDNSNVAARTITVAYALNPYVNAYALVLNNAPTGTKVKVQNSRYSDKAYGDAQFCYDHNTTVYTNTTALADSDILTSGDDSRRKAILVDNRARTIVVNYFNDSDPADLYYIEVTGLQDNSEGDLVLDGMRYVHGSTIDMTGKTLANLSYSPLTNYTASITMDQGDNNKIVVAYTLTGSDVVQITYNVYYDGELQMRIPVSARIGEPYPHIDGTSNGTVAGKAYGEMSGVGYLPYGVFGALHYGGQLVYDAYPSGIVTSAKSIDLQVQYLYNTLKFFPEGTRYTKIDQWYAATLGANGARMNTTAGTADPALAKEHQRYLYARSGAFDIDQTTTVLLEDEYIVLPPMEAAYSWAMVGTPFKFRIMNRQEGAGKYLKFNATKNAAGEITSGYFSFDDQGTYFFSYMNFAVQPGAYGTAKNGVGTGSGQTLTGVLPAAYGTSMFLYDELMDEATPTYYQMQLTVDASGNANGVTFQKMDVLQLHNRQGFMYVGTMSSTVSTMEYTVRVVVPSDADGTSAPLTVGGLYVDGTSKPNGTVLTYAATPDNATLVDQVIGVDGYTGLVSVDAHKRNIIVTYVRSTSNTDLRYVRNEGKWAGFYMSGSEAGEAVADPRKSALVRFLPSGQVMTVVNGQQQYVPCFDVWDSSDGGYYWDNMIQEGLANTRERYVLQAVDGSFVTTLKDGVETYQPQIGPHTTYRFVDAYHLSRGERHIVLWDGSPYKQDGNESVTGLESDDTDNNGLWQFPAWEEPVAVTLNCQLVNLDHHGSTVLNDAYVYWADRTVKNGDKMYVLSRDVASIPSLRIPIVDNGVKKRLYCQNYDATSRTMYVSWMDLNVVGSVPELQALLTDTSKDHIFYMVNASGHGFVVGDLSQYRLTLGGAYEVDGLDVASPDFVRPLNILDPANIWRIGVASTGHIYLQNAGNSHYVAAGDDHLPIFKESLSPVNMVEFNADGTMSTSFNTTTTTRVGADITKAGSGFDLLPQTSADAKWYLLSPDHVFEYTVLANIEAGGLYVKASGQKYSVFDNLVFPADLDEINRTIGLDDYLAVVPLPGYNSTLEIVPTGSQGGVIYVRYSIDITEDRVFMTYPSYTTSPWSGFVSSVMTKDGTVTPGGKFYAGDQAARVRMKNIGRLGSDNVLTKQVYFGIKPYAADVQNGTQYSTSPYADYCRSFTLADQTLTGHIYVDGQGYITWNDAASITAVGSKDKVQFKFTSEASLAERFVFLRADQFLQNSDLWPTGNGFNFIYDTEVFIIPERSLGYIGKNPAGYVGQLILGYNGLDGSQAEHPLGLTSLADLCRLSKTQDGDYYGAINRRHCFPFELAPAASTNRVDFNVSITGLPAEMASEDVLNMAGNMLTPGTHVQESYTDLSTEDMRVKPVDGYRYSLSKDGTDITLAYEPCQKVTEFSQFANSAVYTIRSKTDRGYLYLDQGWQKNFVTNGNPAMTMAGSWDPDYRFMGTPLDFADDAVRWGVVVPKGTDLTGSEADLYLGSFVKLMVTPSASNAWALSQDQLRPVTFVRCDDGSWKLKSRRYNADGTVIAGSDYWLRCPDIASGAYGMVGDPHIASATDGDSDDLRWIFESIGTRADLPVFNTTLDGIFKSGEKTGVVVRIYNTQGTPVVTDDVLEATLTADKFADDLTAEVILGYESDMLRLDVTPPAGYVWDAANSSIVGRDITVRFTETLTHMIARAKSIYKDGKKKFYASDGSEEVSAEADTYASASERPDEDKRTNIYYGYPSEGLYKALRTAIVTAVNSASESDAARLSALQTAINTFFLQAKSMDNITVPNGTELVRLSNALTGRRVDYDEADVAAGNQSNWSKSTYDLGQLFFLSRDTDYPDDPTRFVAHNALGRLTKVQGRSMYDMGHPEFLDPEAGSTERGGFYVMLDKTGMPMSDPWNAVLHTDKDVDKLYAWGMGAFGEKLDDAPDHKFNYMRAVNTGYTSAQIYDLVYVDVPQGEDATLATRIRHNDSGTKYVVHPTGFVPLVDGDLDFTNNVINTYTSVPPTYGTCSVQLSLVKATAEAHGQVKYTYSQPDDYYWQRFNTYLRTEALNALRANADVTLTDGWPTAVEEKGYGYPVGSVNQTYLANLNTELGIINAVADKATFKYDDYVLQMENLDGFMNTYLSTSNVKVPQAGDIVSVTGVGDAADGSTYYNIVSRSGDRLALEDVKYETNADGTFKLDAAGHKIPLPVNTASTGSYTNNNYWIVEQGPNSGGVYLKTAYGNNTYMGYYQEMNDTPQEWYFVRGTQLGRLALFMYANVPLYGGLKPDHTIESSGSKMNTAEKSTDLWVGDAKAAVMNISITTPSTYTGAAPKLTLKSVSYVAQTPLTDGGYIVTPVADVSSDAATNLAMFQKFFLPQQLPGYEASMSTVQGSKTLVVTYVEALNTVQVRAEESLENLKYVTTLYGDYNQPDSPYAVALAAVRAATTTDQVNAAMATFYRTAENKTVKLENVRSTGYLLGSVSGANRGGTYLGTATTDDEYTHYQLMYSGDGSVGTYLFYNMGAGNFIGRMLTTTTRMNSASLKANAGLYTLTTINESSTVYLTNTNAATADANIINEMAADHTIMPTNDNSSPSQHWVVASGESQLPVPGNYYYVQHAAAYSSQSVSNGSGYTEDTAEDHREGNPAFLFKVSRSGKSYVVENLAGGYLKADGSLSQTEVKLTTAQVSALTFTQEVKALDALYAQLLEAYATASRYPIGSEVGQYTNGTPALTAAASGGAKATARTALAGTVTADDITALQTAVAKLTLNHPQSTFYRIRSVASGTYLTMEGGVNEANMKLKAYAADDVNAHTLFWLQEKDQTASASDSVYTDAEGNLQYKVLGYSNGQYMQSTFLLTSAAYQESASKFCFSPGSTIGSYLITSDARENRYLSASVNSNHVVSAAAPTTDETDWYLEPVSSVPVTVGVSGYATLHLPVAVTIPPSLAVGYGSEVTTDGKPAGSVGRVVLTTLSDVIPAFTPVIIYDGTQTSVTYEFPLSTSAADAPTSVLKGTYSTQTQADWFATYKNAKNAGTTYQGVYVLMKGKVNGTETVGFFGDYIGNLSGFKAVLPKKAADSFGAVKGFVFDWGGAIDAIDAVTITDTADSDFAPVYTPQGLYVGNSLQGLRPGLYIRRGQRIMVRQR